MAKNLHREKKEMQDVYRWLWLKILPNLNIFFNMVSSFLLAATCSTHKQRLMVKKNAKIEQDRCRKMVKTAPLLFGFLEHKESETGCF